MLGCWCAAQRNVNIYTDAHMGAVLCARESQKCDQLFSCSPSPFSPSSLSVVLKAQTHQFLLLGRVASAIHCLEKPPFECKSSIHPWPSEAIRSTQLIHKQKCRAEWKGSGVAYWSCWEGSKLSHKLPPSSSRCSPATRPKPCIDFQPPWWSLSAAGAAFSAFLLNEGRLQPTTKQVRFLTCCQSQQLINNQQAPKGRHHFWGGLSPPVCWAALYNRKPTTTPCSKRFERVMYSEPLVPRDNSVIY